MRRIMTIALAVIIGALLILALVYCLGPRTPVDTTIAFAPSQIGDDLDAFLKTSEARYSDIRPGLQKQILWAVPERHAQTPVSLVYIHGFSASSGEMRPLPDILAKNIGANLYLTRLAGHGRSDAAMAEPSVKDWLNDVAEAIAIGETLGHRVVIISTSTGGSLATYCLAQPQFRNRVAAVIFVSPNYAVSAAGAFLLSGPWARQLAHLILGPERQFQPVTALHAQYWTHRYPTDALLPMAASVDLAGATPVETIRTPALFVISPEDRVVKPQATRDMVLRWGGPAELYEIGSVEDPYRHVLAGDALSPATTKIMAGKMEAWIRGCLEL